MKNITVSVDDETYRRSRIKAAEAGTSVSSLVKSFLQALTAGQAPAGDFDSLARLQAETLATIHARIAAFRASDNLSREALHERDALR